VLILDRQLSKIRKYLWLEMDDCLERIKKNIASSGLLDAAEQERQLLISLVCLLPDEILQRHPLGGEHLCAFIAKLREFKKENEPHRSWFHVFERPYLVYQQKQCDMLVRLGVAEEIDFATAERIRKQTSRREKTNAADCGVKKKRPSTSSSSSDDTSTESDSTTDSESSDRSPNREIAEEPSHCRKNLTIGGIATLVLIACGAFLRCVFPEYCWTSEASVGKKIISPEEKKEQDIIIINNNNIVDNIVVNDEIQSSQPIEETNLQELSPTITNSNNNINDVVSVANNGAVNTSQPTPAVQVGEEIRVIVRLNRREREWYTCDGTKFVPVIDVSILKINGMTPNNSHGNYPKIESDPGFEVDDLKKMVACDLSELFSEYNFSRQQIGEKLVFELESGGELTDEMLE